MVTEVDRLLGGIRDGNYHAGGIRCLRLFTLERNLSLALRGEIDRLCAAETGSDVQQCGHVTHWARPRGCVRQFSLLNRSGDFTDYRDDHDLSCLGKRFHHSKTYPSLASFIALFPHSINFRVNLLGPNSALALHEEHSLFMSRAGAPAVRARFHLPIRSHRQARMQLDGQAFRFLPRSIYYFNQGCVHDATNPGPATRIHLVWDMLLTGETFALMFGADLAAADLRRIEPAARFPRCLGRADPGHYVSIPPLVTPLEARRLTLSPVQ
ncbi:aspartyl/asparaginyl beta-hydroxylase domain-containing protein [Methylocystis sp. H62]|uniref:aspartyl/asparaginyl beta-hydroxylase domain-containing protein n=1 Tax=Methylocystis sp. H62 TaxID=2785789 RepID=UPI0018C2F7C2|nr:aspartyl/asparaginyl beta-hydroxylase domain-containing protein [Methylocystis sp. H62]MBG0794474.1 aspartyl/asparaginyl beta-hydroxylase domain-containing protein [Methylocystis sp. H62]